MTQTATELYQAVILEHNRNPRGYGDLVDATHRADGFNPICGDKVTITLRLTGTTLEDVRFSAQSCALCRASASVMVEALKGQTTEGASTLSENFESMIRGSGGVTSGASAAFGAIKDYPARAKCVILPWRTFKSAVKNQSTVSTENEE